MDTVSEKIEQLKKYFEEQYPELSLVTRFDTDFLAQSFRFDRGSEVVHLLMISKVVLDDYSSQEVIEKLKSESWMEVITRHGSKPIMFTSRGFQVPTRRR